MQYCVFYWSVAAESHPRLLCHSAKVSDQANRQQLIKCWKTQRSWLGMACKEQMVSSSYCKDLTLPPRYFHSYYLPREFSFENHLHSSLCWCQNRVWDNHFHCCKAIVTIAKCICDNNWWFQSHVTLCTILPMLQKFCKLLHKRKQNSKLN